MKKIYWVIINITGISTRPGFVLKKIKSVIVKKKFLFFFTITEEVETVLKEYGPIHSELGRKHATNKLLERAEEDGEEIYEWTEY